MHYRKKGNRWYYSTTIVDERTGKKKHIERAGGATKAEAREAALKAMKEMTNSKGHLDEPEHITLRQLWDEYYRSCCEGRLKPATLRSYRNTMQNRVLPVLGDTPIGDLRPLQLQHFLDDQADTMAHASLSMQLTLLKAALRYAVTICTALPYNPAAGVRVPGRARPPATTYVFTQDDLHTIFEHYPRGHRLRLPIMLAYYTGMRAGECLALQWSDIDMDAMTISIHSTLYTDHHAASIRQDTPKTSSSVRIVPICAKLADEIRAARAHQAECRLYLGQLYHPSDYVCTRDDGHHLISNDVAIFGQYCRLTFGAGSFHSLRHTHATMCLEAGEPLDTVSKRLGHSSIAITANIYSHIRAPRVEKSRALIDHAL